jgi:hypothetical protein
MYNLNSNEIVNSTYYLYSVTPKHFKNKEYFDVIDEKLRLGERLLGVLSEEDFLKRDTHRIYAVSEAVKFNIALLTELEMDH